MSKIWKPPILVFHLGIHGSVVACIELPSTLLV